MPILKAVWKPSTFISQGRLSPISCHLLSAVMMNFVAMFHVADTWELCGEVWWMDLAMTQLLETKLLLNFALINVADTHKTYLQQHLLSVEEFIKHSNFQSINHKIIDTIEGLLRKIYFRINYLCKLFWKPQIVQIPLLTKLTWSHQQNASRYNLCQLDTWWKKFDTVMLYICKIYYILQLRMISTSPF